MTTTQMSNTQNLARFLGWFSIGLGLAEVVAPGRLGRMVGVEGHPGLMRGYGLREFLSGVGILAARRQAPFLWARVAGDAIDLVTLTPGLTSFRRQRQFNSAVAIAAVAAVSLLDIYCAIQTGADSSSRTA